MEKKNKYSTPECESLQLSLKCIIAASPDYTTTVANPFSGGTEVDW